MAKIENPPAFPRPLVGSDEAGTVDFGAEGMSLLDWFAGQALVAMLQDHGDECDGYRAAVTWRAYRVAYDMLKARAAAEG